MNRTSSSGPLSIVRLERRRQEETIRDHLAALNEFGFRSDDCHSEKFGAGIAGSPIGRIRVRTPKVSVTTSESTRVTEPTGSVSGTTNQSFP